MGYLVGLNVVGAAVGKGVGDLVGVYDGAEVGLILGIIVNRGVGSNVVGMEDVGVKVIAIVGLVVVVVVGA